MDGVINVNKEKGYTSHDVVAIIRKLSGQKKVGHTGTLDPQATGVLPICLGRATKLADYIMAEKKQYFAEVTLGVTTTTQDATGEILQTKEVFFQPEAILQAVQSFVGEIQQVPPMYSAIKVNGKKLYELAREGKEISRKARNITIYQIEPKKFLPPNRFEMVVTCSKGTYIRTLCADIGEKLECGAHMSSLTRLSSGNFSLKDSYTLEQLKELAKRDALQTALTPIDQALKEYPHVIVCEKASKQLYNGCKISEQFYQSEKTPLALGEVVLCYDYQKQLVGIFQAVYNEVWERACIKPLKILR